MTESSKIVEWTVAAIAAVPLLGWCTIKFRDRIRLHYEDPLARTSSMNGCRDELKKDNQEIRSEISLLRHDVRQQFKEHGEQDRERHEKLLTLLVKK